MAGKTLDVKGFIESRVEEIKKMQTAIQTIGGSRSLFQTVPRRMRRRAASHNRKRLPNRLTIKDPTNNKLVTASKKNKRRRTARKRNIKRNDNASKWLETHIWHAKRMKMANKWNFKVASICCEKGRRAAYRACKNDCTLQDVSYYRCIQITGLQELIMTTFGHLTSHQTGSAINSVDYLQGGMEGCLMCYHYDSYPYQAIGPVTFLWNCTDLSHNSNNLKRSLWLWCHPSCYKELLDQITLASQQNRQDEGLEIYPLASDDNTLLRFSLRGPTSQSVLHRALTLISERSAIEDVWNKLLNLSSTAVLPRGSVLSLNVGDPRLNRPVLKQRCNNLDQLAVIDSSQTCFQNWSYEFAKTSLWDPAIRKSITDAKKPDHELNKLRMQYFDDQLKLSIEENKICIPIMLVQQSSGTATLINIDNQCDFINSGWDVILPAGWGMPFWLSFIYCGARAIGLQESAKQYLEQGIPIFPSDYPDTAAGCFDAAETCQNLMSDYYLRPPAKRINYSKIGISSPFFNPWKELLAYWKQSLKFGISKVEENTDETNTFYVLRCRKELYMLNKMLKQVCKPHRNQNQRITIDTDNVVIENLINSHSHALVAVKIKMHRRGAPTQFCPICLPNDEDLLKLKDQSFKGNLDIPSLKKGLERDVIGYLSCGDFSHSVGYGIAVGYCSLLGLTKLLVRASDQDENFILIRNIRSYQYYFATIQILIF